MGSPDTTKPDDWLWFSHALLDEGWKQNVRVAVTAGQVAAIQTGKSAQPGDLRSGIALPGLPNLHSHAFQRAMAGLTEVRDAEGSSFWTWREAMYRFVDRLSPEQLEAVTALAYLEMLESGFTRVGEFHYLHHDVDGGPYSNPAELATRIVAAAASTGIRLTLLPVLYSRSGFGGGAPRPAQRRFINNPDSFAKLLERAHDATRGAPGAVLGVAAHSLRAVTPDELDFARNLRPNHPFHIHIAEQTAEVDDCVAWSGARPVRWLLDHAPVDERWCLVHATHVDDGELSGIARTHAVVGLCPITEANLGDGLFPAEEFAVREGRFGVGSDSNVRIDAAEELNVLEYGQRLRDRKRNVLAIEPGHSTGRALFDRANEGGAGALGVMPSRIGVGMDADIVALDDHNSLLVARSGDAFLDSWIVGGHREVVREVWVGGQLVVAEGRHVLRDSIQARYSNAIRALLA